MDEQTVRQPPLPLLNSFQIGCDPEFRMRGKGKLQTPMTPFWSTEEACIPATFTAYHNSSFGQDGHNFELRPQPSKSTYKLAGNIRSLLEQGSRFIRQDANYSWLANPYSRFPSGGHVHIEGTWDNKVEQPMGLLDLCLMKSNILPEEPSKKRQKLYSHGLQTRTDHQGRWEYRRFGTWMFHPRTAFCVLTLSKLVNLEPQYAVGILKVSNPWGSLKLLSDTYKSQDDDARRLSQLFEVGEKALVNSHRYSFLNRWLRWKPEEESKGGSLSHQ